MFSVAINGNSLSTWEAITLSYTTIFSAIFMYKFNTPSNAKNPSATDNLLLAESSKVLSNHWVPAVIAGFNESTITNLAKALILSLLIGFLL